MFLRTFNYSLHGLSCSKDGLRYPVDNAILVSPILKQWIVIYLVKGAIHHLRNRSVVYILHFNLILFSNIFLPSEELGMASEQMAKTVNLHLLHKNTPQINFEIKISKHCDPAMHLYYLGMFRIDCSQSPIFP